MRIFYLVGWNEMKCCTKVETVCLGNCVYYGDKNGAIVLRNLQHKNSSKGFNATKQHK